MDPESTRHAFEDLAEELSGPLRRYLERLIGNLGKPPFARIAFQVDHTLSASPSTAPYPVQTPSISYSTLRIPSENAPRPKSGGVC